jgi:type II secretory pathway pseudopilin PulG
VAGNIVPLAKIIFVAVNNIYKMQKGITLIELILYIAISSFMLLVIFLFSSQIFEARIKGQTIVEVEQQGDWVVQTITQAIRNSVSPVNSPTIGSSGGALILTMVDGTKNPTIFALTSGLVTITENGNFVVPLTNSNIIISNLLFQNVSKPGTNGSIKFSFDATYKNLEGARYEYNYSKTFYGSGTIRY